MSMPTPEQLRSLLLHRLTEEESAPLEEQLMQDAEVADLLRHEETDLVDDYAQGRLTASDRQAFEQHLLAAPEIRQRVKVARALEDFGARHAEAMSPAKGGFWKRIPVRAVAVLVVCAVALGLVLLATRGTVGPESSGIPPTPDTAREPIPDATPEPTAPIVLLADVGRGGSAQVVRVPAGAGPVRLQVEATSSDSSLSYRLSVADESGRTLFAAEDLSPRESGGYVFVEAEIPAATLGTGPRKVTLEPRRPGAESFSWELNVQP